MVQMSLDRGADIHEVEFVADHDHAHGGRIATTICVPPLCTSWPTQSSPYWLSLVFCSGTLRLALMDPLAGLLGAVVIAAGLTRLFAIPARPARYESGPGHGRTDAGDIEPDGDQLKICIYGASARPSGAILSVATSKPRDAGHYRRLLHHFRNLSHVTVEVQQT